MLEVFFSRNNFTARRFLKKAKALMMKHDPTVTDHLGGLFPSQAQTACCSSYVENQLEFLGPLCIAGESARR